MRHQLSSLISHEKIHSICTALKNKSKVVEKAPVRYQIHKCDLTRSLNTLKHTFNDLTCATNTTLHGLRKSSLLIKVSLKKPAQTLRINGKVASQLTSVLNVSMHPMPRNPVARWQRLVVQVFQVANSGPVQFGDRSQVDTWRVPNGCRPKLGCADPTSTCLRFKKHLAQYS